jgi:iron complex transport system substrate-binding protein
MRLSRIRLFLFLAALFFISFPSLSANSSNAMGNLPGKPQRIVSLSPAITEALYLLGLESGVIAVTTYCRKPPRAQGKEKIGSIIAPDIEKIVSLKPDLVIAMNLTDIREIEKLKILGLNVATFRIPRNFSQLCNVFLELGKIVGKANEAKRLVNKSRERVFEVTNRVKSMPRQEVLVQIGSKPLFVATKDIFLNDYVEFAGGINIFRDAGSGAISMEEAVKRDPDVIIIATMGISGENELRLWKRFSRMKAVKNKRVYIIDADRLCSPTPVSFAEYLSEIVHILHPGGQCDG